MSQGWVFPLIPAFREKRLALLTLNIQWGSRSFSSHPCTLQSASKAQSPFDKAGQGCQTPQLGWYKPSSADPLGLGCAFSPHGVFEPCLNTAVGAAQFNLIQITAPLSLILCCYPVQSFLKVEALPCSHFPAATPCAGIFPLSSALGHLQSPLDFCPVPSGMGTLGLCVAGQCRKNPNFPLPCSSANLFQQEHGVAGV